MNELPTPRARTHHSQPRKRLIAPDDIDESLVGKERYIPTESGRDQVMKLSAAGVPQEVIAYMMNISQETLLAVFPMELSHGGHIATGTVAGCLYDTAVRGRGRDAVEAQKFWLSTKGNFNTSSRHEHTGPDGAPIAIDATIAALTDQERAVRLLQVLNKLRVTGAGSTPAGDPGSLAAAAGSTNGSVLQPR